MKSDPMLAVKIHFLAGRFHATPWDHQVNEGVVEWPPSPWRFLRALISTWHLKAREDLDEGILRSIVLKLRSRPEYHLPPASLGHTRHFMPLYRTDRGASSMIFDAFAYIKDEYHLNIIWPDADLLDEELEALDILLERIGYLGRAESWIEASRTGNSQECNCAPYVEGSPISDDQEMVEVLVPIPPDEYEEWRKGVMDLLMEKRLAEKKIKARKGKRSSNETKLSKKEVMKLESLVPSDLYMALQQETTDLRKAGWSQPPGSRWVTYMRMKGAFDIDPIPRVGAEMEPPMVARYAVTSQAPPRLTDAISLAERIHKSLVSISNGHRVFRGCDEDGVPLKGHMHAHILCESNLALGQGRRGEITHVTIYAPMGFDKKARTTLDRLTKVWGYGGHDIQLVLLGLGHSEDFAGLDLNKGQAPIFSRVNVWVSRTPFVPTRHPKSTRAGEAKLDENGLQIGSPEHDLRRLLRECKLPEPDVVEAIPSTDLAGHETRWLKFRRERKDGKGNKGTNLGYGFRLVFSEPVRGPMALGYGCHFGLGLFLPEA